AELVLVFSIRSGALPAWRAPRNPILVASVLVSVSLLALSIYLPALHDAFGTESLELGAAAIVGCLAVAPAALTETAKAVLRRRGRR
ncbi:MAG TPA: cation transporting ATPase C-terminal domain-containing protein, partial [Gaiellaceae bacterium]|nr:cation transporting ATPase C-terminal domain-containing protein [Gaiellaceae bacterium]